MVRMLFSLNFFSYIKILKFVICLFLGNLLNMEYCGEYRKALPPGSWEKSLRWIFGFKPPDPPSEL